jgi:Fur family ferric uptake transcriptional regulator
MPINMIASTQTNHPLVDVKIDPASPAPLQQACARLKSAGLRITQPRIAILSAMISRNQPTSIEQIHGDLEAGSCDLVTVYRCLAAFEEIGLVRRSFFHNGTSLYEISLGLMSRYHVVCKASNRVEEIDPETTAELRSAIQAIEEKLRTRGYENVSHVVEFFGVAPANQRSTPVAASR